ncbi:hypothetical protein LOD99_10268 [Oopsacas minuta]|uniref:Uncharacterized protein n=1 Tax=Oopsacas minuta TaxID=111878 RepID=A0AAV7KLK5_9METZ|nr:hypothetical protein LOD99_10268 [Oopsacas minuta]
MSHRPLSRFDIFPQGQTINSLYYRKEILAKLCRHAINRTANTEHVSEREMLENMSDFIFMQDGAPAHKTKLTQEWCRGDLNGFGRKLTGQEFSGFKLNPVSLGCIEREDKRKSPDDQSGLVK